jgi:LysR family transcriptional regulator, low CO2-responsive transcriptional regulator
MIATQIRAFDAVAREGSFSRAAHALCLTQPAVTIQVKALEDSYGVKLLERNGRSVTLTAIGEQIFSLTRQMASLEEQIRDKLQASDELAGNTLRLAIDGPHIAMPILGSFQAHYPKVAVSVAMGNTQFVRRELLDRRADIAILPGVSNHPMIHAQKLREHRAVLIVALSHPWARRREVSIDELTGFAMIRREAGSTTQKAIDDALRAAGVTPTYVLELGSREALCEAVAAGIGCGIVWDVEAKEARRYRSIPLKGKAVKSTDYVACLKSEAPRQVIQAFLQVAMAAEHAEAA